MYYTKCVSSKAFEISYAMKIEFFKIVKYHNTDN